jgi:site-specific DNA-methyltransferase (adenine-specific)
VVPVTAPATELAKRWDGYGTALKPGWEPIILARKPLDGTVAGNVTKWGTGALAIDACRLGREPGDVSGWSKTGSAASENVAMSGGNYARDAKPDADGRWPANVALDEEAAEILDTEVGDRQSGRSITRNGGGGHIFNGLNGHGAKPDGGYSDSGGPSRFYFSAKVSTREREFGCHALPKRSAGEVTDREDDSVGLASPRAGAGRTGGAHNHHPTLKPIALAKWLASLIKPPISGSMLLVPYAGAGSEIIGALQAGWPFVFGIEGQAEYVEIAHARIKAWVSPDEVRERAASVRT